MGTVANEKTKLLLVDDDEDLRFMTSSLLMLAPCEVTEAATGFEGLEKTRQERPDLVLLDVQLPDVNGFEICRQIKADPALSGVLVVMVSGRAVSLDSQTEGLRSGADGYITRPFAKDDFLARIEAFSRIARAERKLRQANQNLERQVQERTAELSVSIGQLRQRGAIMQAINASAERLLRDRDLDAGMADVAHQLGQATGLSRCHIFTARITSDEVFVSLRREWVAEGVTPQRDNPGLRELPVKASGFGQWADLLLRGEPVFGQTSELPDPARALLAAQDIDSLALVPISVGDQRWGFISFDACVAPHEWSDHEREELRAAANLLGYAIQRHQATERGDRLNRCYGVLSRMNQLIVRASTPHELFEGVCRTAVEDGFFRMAWVGLLDPETRLLRPVARAGHTGSYLDTVSISAEDVPSGRGPTGTAVREGRHAVCNDFRSDDAVLPWRDLALANGYCASGAFPLTVHGKTIGAVTLYAPLPGVFDTEEIRLLSGMAQDVSHALQNLESEQRRRQAEEQLAASERKYRDVVQNISECVLSGAVSEDGSAWQLEFVSPRLASICGYTPEEFRRRPNAWLRLVHPEDLPQVTAGLQAALRDGVAVTRSYRLIHKATATYRWVETTLVPQRQPGNPRMSFFGTIRDIHDRKQSEEEQRKLVTLIENSSDFIGMATVEGRLFYVNRAGRQLVGLANDDAVKDRSWFDFFSAEDQPEARATLLPTILRDGRWQGEFRFQSLATGQTIPIELNGFVFCDPASGQPTCLAILGRDITERLKAHEAVRRSLHEKELLLKEIHHRVKNNLQVISSLLGMRADSVVDVTARNLLLESQHRVRCMAMIHERLYQSEDLTRVDFGEYVYSFANLLVRNYAANVAPVALHVDVDEGIHVNIETAIPCGLILNELISNALKHAAKDGRRGELRVELRRVNAHFNLTVSDNGPGLPPGFDLRNAPSLGLQIVDTLTKQLKGKLTFETRAGAIFNLDFKELVYAQHN